MTIDEFRDRLSDLLGEATRTGLTWGDVEVELQMQVYAVRENGEDSDELE